MTEAFPDTTAPRLTVQQIGAHTVVEFNDSSLMDPVLLEQLGTRLYKLVDEEDHRILILDFSRVQFLSSQALGILLMLKKKLDALPRSRLILCGVGPKLMELLKIMRLELVLTIKPTQREALKVDVSL